MQKNIFFQLKQISLNLEIKTMKFFKLIHITLAFLIAYSCTPSGNNNPLIKTFAYVKGKEAVISAHRGGKIYAGYPENCLETMNYVMQQVPNALFEIDIAQSKDSILFLMHDDALERTTTGSGRIDQKTWTEIEVLQLKDNYGSVTKYSPPAFRDVLHWATSRKTHLSVDIKRSVNPETVLKFIEKHHALYNCVIITYSVETAKKLYALNHEVFLSVTIRNMDEFRRFKKSGIPWENIQAFTGTHESDPELYQKLHKKGVMCVLGTLGNLDAKAEAKGDQLYKAWAAKGIDIFATDRPIEVYQALK